MVLNMPLTSRYQYFMERKSVAHFPVSIGDYKQFVEKIVSTGLLGNSDYVCVGNVHMLVEASKNKEFGLIVHNAGLITPDGMPLIWSLKLLHGIRQSRVAGMELLPDLLKSATMHQLPVYFYGADEKMLNTTRDHIKSHFGGLIVAGMYSPHFRSLSVEEEVEVVKKINESGARLVFVILGCPKQEKWMASMKGRIHAVMIGIGGALPVMIGMQKRAPRWMQQAGLEWSFRLLQEPRRLFKRYVITNSMFLLILFREIIRIRILKRPSYS